MRTVAVSALNRLVRNEPRVAAAAHALRSGSPAIGVRLILIRNAERESIEVRVTERREMKNELVTVVEKTFAVDRLVVADCQIASQSRRPAGRRAVDRNPLDPVNDDL